MSFTFSNLNNAKNPPFGGFAGQFLKGLLQVLDDEGTCATAQQA
jgi:hypothetical protein